MQQYSASQTYPKEMPSQRLALELSCKVSGNSTLSKAKKQLCSGHYYYCYILYSLHYISSLQTKRHHPLILKIDEQLENEMRYKKYQTLASHDKLTKDARQASKQTSNIFLLKQAKFLAAKQLIWPTTLWLVSSEV